MPINHRDTRAQFIAHGPRDQVYVAAGTLGQHCHIHHRLGRWTTMASTI